MKAMTVTELVANFSEACRALVPALDRADISWRDGEQYDPWDRMAEAMFASLVIEPCAFQAVGEAGLSGLRAVPYGFVAHEDANAWIVVDGVGRMIDLLTVSKPFDHVRCEGLAVPIPLDEAEFGFVHIAPDGAERHLALVDLAAG